MPFIQGTPESLMARSDSKNPNETCRGLTSTGRPCRRSLAASPGSSKTKVPTTADEEGDPMYCWQHKDQSPTLNASTARPAQSNNLVGRTSIDTLVDRLGIIELEKKKQRRRTEKQNARPSKPAKPAKQHGLLHTLLCCMFPSDEARPTTASTHNEPPRPSTQNMGQRPSHQRRSSIPQIRPPGTPGHRHSSSEGKAGRRPSTTPLSQSTDFANYIPPNTSPNVKSLLLAELAKPVSSGDVPGYIYIFWLTDEKAPKPPARTASTLLPPSGGRGDGDRPRGAGGRRTSEVIQAYATADKKQDKKLLLKIGRANNVQRRLNEWTRQCGYDVSLVRFYPYVDSASRTPSPGGSPGGSPSPGTGPRMVPNVHKVERLIHLELDEQRLSGKGKCERCGVLHQEWFEVDATRDGLKSVDAAIKRWVEWAEQTAV